MPLTFYQCLTLAVEFTPARILGWVWTTPFYYYFLLLLQNVLKTDLMEKLIWWWGFLYKTLPITTLSNQNCTLAQCDKTESFSGCTLSIKAIHQISTHSILASFQFWYRCGTWLLFNLHPLSIVNSYYMFQSKWSSSNVWLVK